MSIEWLAGLLEGEGCFGRYSAGPKQPHLRYARIQLGMTDEDVVRRVHEFTGVGHVYEPKQRPGCKRIWIWHARNHEAESLMQKLHPLMGLRRQAKIDEVLTREA